MVDFWVEGGRGREPFAVQIAARKRASVVAVDDAVWVEHGDYFEDESLP